MVKLNLVIGSCKEKNNRNSCTSENLYIFHGQISVKTLQLFVRRKSITKKFF